MNQEIVNIHDRFFKQVLSQQEAAGDFLRHYLPPEVVASFDLSSLEMSKDSFVDESLRTYFSDLLYKVKMQGEGDAYIYVLFEHKSYPEGLIAFHLLRYMVKVWEQSLKQREQLAPIVPVVVYHGRVKWKVGLNFACLFDVPEAFEDFLPDYRYWLCDLTEYSDEEIKGQVILRIALLLLKYILRPGLDEQIVGIVRLLNELSDRQTALEYLETILRYVSQASDEITEETLKQAVEEAFPEGGEVMSTLAERWVEQGLQQGLQQGIQQGLILDAQEMVLSAIEAKLGYVPEEIEKKVKTIFDREKLRHLLKEIIKSSNLSKVFEKYLG